MLRTALFAARSASARGSAPAVARGLRWALCPVVGTAAGRHWPLQAGWGMLSGGRPRAFSEAKAGDGAFLPSMSSPGSQADLMDEGEYRGLVDMTLENIEDVVNEMCDEVPGFDSTLADGVLSINMGDLGTFVLNIQAPNRQIWLSSPISGPARYNFESSTRTWVNNRNEEQVLERLLSEELTELVGEAVDIDQAEI